MDENREELNKITEKGMEQIKEATGRKQDANGVIETETDLALLE